MLRRFWYGQSLRTQLLVAVAAINLCALAAAGTISIVNARNATREEIEASLEMAKNFVRVTVQALQPDGDAAPLSTKFNRLSSRLQLARLRHVRIYVADASGKLVQVSPREDRAAPVRPAPAWFAALVEPSVTPTELSVVLADPKARTLLMVEQPREAIPRTWTLGTVVVAGEPADEIAEIWQDVSSVAVVWLALVVLILATLYVVLARILHPLAGLEKGILKLEDGDYATRLVRPPVSELASIAERFNNLAGALERARSENGRLYGQLITVQEDERREIANELHDEASPCLFGIMANTMSVQRLIERRHDRKSLEAKSHLNEILRVTERLKGMNRAMLKRLRPVALGRVALPALVEDLVADLRRRYPEVRLSHSAKLSTANLGEAVDLTVYRCIQEGVTNAIRHGKADAVHVELLEQVRSAANGVKGVNGHKLNGARATLLLKVQDNGSGLSPETPFGFGLTAMRERVNALGGSCAIQGTPSNGTTLKVTIPIAPQAAPRSKHARRIEAH